MQLKLVKITDIETRKISYYALNDMRYEDMASSFPHLDDFEYELLGEVEIDEQVLYEEGFREHGA